MIQISTCRHSTCSNPPHLFLPLFPISVREIPSSQWLQLPNMESSLTNFFPPSPPPDHSKSCKLNLQKKLTTPHLLQCCFLTPGHHILSPRFLQSLLPGLLGSGLVSLFSTHKPEESFQGCHSSESDSFQGPVRDTLSLCTPCPHSLSSTYNPGPLLFLAQARHLPASGLLHLLSLLSRCSSLR